MLGVVNKVAEAGLKLRVPVEDVELGLRKKLKMLSVLTGSLYVLGEFSCYCCCLDLAYRLELHRHDDRLGRRAVSAFDVGLKYILIPWEQGWRCLEGVT